MSIRQTSMYIIFLIAVVLLFSCQVKSPDLADRIPDNMVSLCGTCHGSDLKGDIAQSLLDGSWQFGSRVNDITRSIKFGHPHHGMPSWNHVLTGDEIDTMVAFLLKEEKNLGIGQAPIPEEIETQDYLLNVEIFAEGLTLPWSMEFIGDNRALITERSGRLRVVDNGTLKTDSVKGIPVVTDGGQGGLMDVAVDPDFDENGWIYLAYSHALEKKEGDRRPPRMTRIVRGHLVGNRWEDNQVIFEANHEAYRTAGQHFGGRITFDHEGYLFFSIGDRGSMDDAQDLSKPNGKIHRIHPNGAVPIDNPFVGKNDALKSVYSFGHRNPQGLAVHPETGQIWDTEHGPLGGDELNLIEAGRNYGWPVISYGINYNGEIITDLTHKEGMEQPIYYWKPSIAVCGLHFYEGDLFPKWKNKLLVGALKFSEVQLLDIEKDRVMYQQTLLKNAGRVRDITVGPDGAIYVVLNVPGTVLRLTPMAGQSPQL